MSALRPTQIGVLMLFRIMVAFVGLLTVIIALKHFGVIAQIMGGAFGFFVCVGLGNIAYRYENGSMYNKISNCSTAKLKQIVGKWPIWNFYVTLAQLELAARGEDVRDNLPRLVTMLESDDRLKRVYGRDGVRLVFTKLAKRIGDYDPFQPAEKCRKKVAFLHDSLEEFNVQDSADECRRRFLVLQKWK